MKALIIKLNNCFIFLHISGISALTGLTSSGDQIKPSVAKSEKFRLIPPNQGDLGRFLGVEMGFTRGFCRRAQSSLDFGMKKLSNIYRKAIAIADLPSRLHPLQLVD